MARPHQQQQGLPELTEAELGQLLPQLGEGAGTVALAGHGVDKRPVDRFLQAHFAKGAGDPERNVGGGGEQGKAGSEPLFLLFRATAAAPRARTGRGGSSD